MADPFTLLAVGLGINTVGGIMSGEAKARAAEQEAALRDMQAREVELKAIRDERITRKAGAEFMGKQTAALGASGFAASLEGTPLILLEDTMFKIEDEVAALKHAASFRASQLRSGAQSLREQAASSRVAGYFGVFGNILTSVGQMDLLRDENNKKNLHKLSSEDLISSYTNDFGWNA